MQLLNYSFLVGSIALRWMSGVCKLCFAATKGLCLICHIAIPITTCKFIVKFHFSVVALLLSCPQPCVAGTYFLLLSVPRVCLFVGTKKHLDGSSPNLVGRLCKNEQFIKC